MGRLDEAASGSSDYGYGESYASIETMLTGSVTYEFVCHVAGPFPHADREVAVFTSRDLPKAAESVTFISEDPAVFTRRLKNGDGGAIWLVGGGILNSTLSAADLIDEVRLFVQPVILGDGVPLFAGPHARLELSLERSFPWPDGVVELRYGRRNG